MVPEKCACWHVAMLYGDESSKGGGAVMTDIKIAKNLLRVEPSASSIASQRARTLKAEGRDIIALSAGEPDFATPEHVIEAAFDAARRGETRYTNAAGTPALKAAVIEKFKRENDLDFANDEVMTGNGGTGLPMLIW